MGETHQVFGDWRDLRGAIEAHDPTWADKPDAERDALWAFAKGVLDNYAPMSVQCGPFGCGAVVPHWQGYRCADCRGVYCETCIKPHFGPAHAAHGGPVAELAEARQHIRDFIRALDRGYLACKDGSAFIDALRAESLK